MNVVKISFLAKAHSVLTPHNRIPLEKGKDKRSNNFTILLPVGIFLHLKLHA